MKNPSLFIIVLAFLCLNEAMGQWTTSGSNIYNTNTGNVGIGTGSPTTLLHVAKSMTEPTMTVQNRGGTGGATYTMTDNASGANWKFKATNSGGFKIRDHANSLDVFVIEPNSAANAIYINSAGSVGIGTATPANSALVDMTSTTKAFSPPGMTQAQIGAISSPANGLVVFCTTDNKIYAFVASANTWKEILLGPGTISPVFSCGSTIIDNDGNVYNTVLIGEQCWMKENLNVGTMINGSQDMADNGTIEKYCYNNDPANCYTYGGLYQWNEIMDYTTTPGIQGICPDGWHIPINAEWEALIIHLGGGWEAGGKMKEAGFVHWYAPNTGATNESGFTALPGSALYGGYGFFNLGSYAYYWSSTSYELNGLSAVFLMLYYADGDAVVGGDNDSSGYSLRCLKD
jgi:uncharacterized protein (TIGR02145 family)